LPKVRARYSLVSAGDFSIDPWTWAARCVGKKGGEEGGMEGGREGGREGGERFK
jgi:hypothetical protein